MPLQQNADVIVLPYVPVTHGSFDWNLVSGGTPDSIKQINGQQREDGSTIRFRVSSGLDTYQAYQTTFYDTNVNVRMGKDPKQLAIVSGGHLKGHYAANSHSGTPSDGYSFHYGISGNGGQYTLSVSSYGEAWFYEADANHPSTWIVRDDTEGGSDDVQFGSSGYARVGTGWIWVDKPAATKILVPKKNGEIHQVDLVKRTTTVVSYAVTAGWVKQHMGNLFNDLANLAQSKGMQSLSVSWTDDQGTDSGTYSPGSDYLVSSSWDGIVRHCRPTDGQMQSSNYVMAGFSEAALSKRNDCKTLAEMVATAQRLGFGNEFDVYGMPWWVGGPTCVCGHYSSKTGALTGVDKDGLMFKMKPREYPTFLAFGPAWFAARSGKSMSVVLQETETMANSRFITECEIYGIPSQSGPGISQTADGRNTLTGHANFSTKTINAATAKGESFEYSWRNGYEFTFRGFNVDFFKGVAGGFEWKLEHAVNEAKANVAKYGSASFDMCAPFDTLPSTLTGHYEAVTCTFVGTDNDGRVFKRVSGSNLQFVGFTSDYFKKNPSFSLRQLSDYAQGRGLSSFSVSGMPSTSVQILSGTWNRDSGWTLEDGDGLIWKCTDSLSHTSFYGFGQQYMKNRENNQPTVPELAAEATLYGSPEWVVVGYAMPKEIPPMTGKYTCDVGTATGRIIGTTVDGLVFARWGREAYQLLGVNGQWLQRYGDASVMETLERLAKWGKTDMLTILDAKDPAGSSVAAWYDSTNKRFIIGKSDHTGQMDLLTVAGKMAWFRQAGQAGLLFSETVPWVRAASMKHIADIARNTRQVFTELGVLDSVEMLDATTISAYSKQLGLTVSFDLTSSGRYRLVNFKSDKPLDVPVLRGIAAKYDCDDAVYAGFGPNPLDYVWLRTKIDLQSYPKRASEGDKLAYIGVNEDAREFYVFNSRSGLMCIGPNSDRTLKADGVVRYGNVVGIWGVDENQLSDLPKMDGVDAYAAMTGNGELTFRICNGKVELLSVGPKWCADNRHDSNALDKLLKRYDHPKEIVLCTDKYCVAYDTQTEQQVG